MHIKSQIQEQIKHVLDELDLHVDTIELTHPQMDSMGDYSTNVAMVLFSNQESHHKGALRIKNQEWKNPRELAQALVDKLMLHDSSFMIHKIEVAGPGFINFYLKHDYFIEELGNLLKDDKKHLNTSFSGKKVMVEFTDPNPFKELHIGHLYDNTIGESLARLIEASGAEVKRVTYQGDVGLHVAKSLYGLQKKLQDESLSLQDIASKPLKERVRFLGESYALGSSAYEESEEAKQKIITLNKAVYEQDESIREMYTLGKAWSLEYFDEIYARLGSKFWKNYFESEAGPVGLALVREYLEKGVFEESEGAVIFPGDKHGLHARVFINSLGLPTYEAKELGLAPTKYKDFPYELSIIVTGNEINEYFKVLLKALSIISPELAAKTTHISHGMVRLPEGKMSSRTGNVRTGEWLLDEAKSRLAKAYPEMTPETLEQVTIAAIKWALLRSGVGKDISFNIDESISFEGDSGPYVQYTYARTRSVLAKSEMSNVQYQMSNIQLESEELSLLKKLVQFDEVVIAAGKHYSPNTITNYLFDLAQSFNLFYQKQRILDPQSVILSESEGSQSMDSSPSVQNDKVRLFRLALTQATGNTLKQGLYLLGIPTPERM